MRKQFTYRRTYFAELVMILSAIFLILITGVLGAPVICHAEESSLKDGTYTIEVSLSGGTGRASVTSPAFMHVIDGTAVVMLMWSSPNFDYMIVNGEQYLPVNTEGDSVFEIPVSVFDEEINVIADTTAMSVPHEVEYTLIFHSDSIRAGQSNSSLMMARIAAVVVLVVVVVMIGKRKKKKHADI